LKPKEKNESAERDEMNEMNESPFPREESSTESVHRIQPTTEDMMNVNDCREKSTQLRMKLNRRKSQRQEDKL
jgi:hypothetical protein